MTKLEEWLTEQGLAQYAGVLADNDIDLDILPDLAESDLGKLGLSLGHRRKLLRAIDALKPALRQPEAPPNTPETQEAERRQVTYQNSMLHCTTYSLEMGACAIAFSRWNLGLSFSKNSMKRGSLRSLSRLGSRSNQVRFG